MIVPKGQRYERPSQDVVLSDKKMEVGFFCHYCQQAFPWYNNTGDIDFNLVHTHHKQPIADGGKHEAENREYLCVKCHKDIHYFIDAFRVLNINLNYEFLTTVYTWYFSARPSPEIKRKYPTEYHCNVEIGKSGVNQLFDDFCCFVQDLKSSGYNLVLFDTYMYYLKCNHKLGHWTLRLYHSLEKPSMLEYNKIKYDINLSIRRIAENYEDILIS